MKIWDLLQGVFRLVKQRTKIRIHDLIYKTKEKLPKHTETSVLTSALKSRYTKLSFSGAYLMGKKSHCFTTIKVF